MKPSCIQWPLCLGTDNRTQGNQRQVGMRKLFLIITMLIGMSVGSFAQTETPVPKEIMKMARREADKLAKEGWKPAVGKPEIMRQLRDVYMKMEYGTSDCVTGTSRRKGLDYQKTHSAALFGARKDVIKNLESYVESEFRQKAVVNREKSHEQTMTATRISAEQNLKKTNPDVDIFRVLSDGEIEVEIRILYEFK